MDKKLKDEKKPEIPANVQQTAAVINAELKKHSGRLDLMPTFFNILTLVSNGYELGLGDMISEIDDAIRYGLIETEAGVAIAIGAVDMALQGEKNLSVEHIVANLDYIANLERR